MARKPVSADTTTGELPAAVETRINAKDAAVAASSDLRYANRLLGTIMLIGDSISYNQGAGGVTLHPNVGLGRCAENNPAASAVAQLGGRFVWAGAAATSGYRTDQIITAHLSTITAAKPGACIVLAGTNDIAQNIALATIKANLVTLWNTIRAAGVAVVAATLPPVSGDTTAHRLAKHQLNQWIALYAAKNGIPLLDYFAAAVGTDENWKSSYSGDGTHPNNIGGNALGAAVAPVLSALSGLSYPPYMKTNSNGSVTGNAINNPLFLNSTVAPGVSPDSWSKAGGGDSVTSTFGDSATGVNGGMWKIVKSAGANGAQWSSGAVSCTPGDTWAIGFKFDFTIASAGSWSLEMRNPANNAALAGYGTATTMPLSGWFQKFVVPTGCTQMQPYITMSTDASTLRLGQFTWLNLTALGIS